VLAQASVNMQKYASDIPTQHDITIKLNPVTQKIVGATIRMTLSCVFLREGKATYVVIIGNVLSKHYVMKIWSRKIVFKYHRLGILIVFIF